MAEQPEPVPVDETEEESRYKAPAVKSVNEILDQDKDDEALERYKQALLGAAPDAVVFADDPRRVIVQKLGLVVAGRPDEELDLSGDLKTLKEKIFRIKEGTQYRIKIYFYVQREIVSGLKYNQRSFRKGIQVDNTTHMVGSYGPKKDLQFFITPPEEAPMGILFRGEYLTKSLFTDDDKHEHLKWEWKIKISKDWD